MIEVWIHYIACFITLSLLGVLAHYDYKRGNPFFIVWFGLVVSFAIPMFFDYDGKIVRINEQASNTHVTWAILFKAQLFAWGFMLIYLITRSALNQAITVPSVHYPTIRTEFFPEDRMKVVAGLSLFAIFIALYDILSRGGINALSSATYSSYRTESNPILKMTSYYLLGIVSGGALISYHKKMMRYFFPIVISVILIFFMSKTRQLLLPLITPFIFYFALRRRRFSKFLGFVVVIIIGYLFMLFLQILRYQGGVSNTLLALTDPQFYITYLESISDFKGEALTRYAFYYFLDENVFLPGFGEGSTYIRLLMLPIPSSFSLGIKPREFNEVLYSSYYMDPGALFGTLHITLFGNSYVNFSWFGVLLGGVWATFSTGCQLLLSKSSSIRKYLLLAPIGWSFLMISRGSIYNSAAVLFYTSIIIWLVTRSYGKQIKFGET